MIKEKQQLVGLAAATQAINLVNKVATTGSLDVGLAESVLSGLLKYNPANALEAYGDDWDNIHDGLEIFIALLSGQVNRDIALYLSNIANIEIKLARDKNKLITIHSSINEIRIQKQNDMTTSLINDDIIAKFAFIYKTTISNMTPKVMVKGDSRYLQNEVCANQIRALLLAAFRGISFFRHNGGNKLQLFLNRKTFVRISQEILG